MAPGTCGQTLKKAGFIDPSIKYVYITVVIIIALIKYYAIVMYLMIIIYTRINKMTINIFSFYRLLMEHFQAPSCHCAHAKKVIIA